MKIKIPSLNFFNKMISKGIYVIPIGNFEYVVGATYNREDLSGRVTKEGKSFLINKLNSILSVDYEILSVSAGVRPNVKDRRPLVGVHPEFSKLYVFNGLGSRGVLVGPSLSQELTSCLISGLPIEDKIKDLEHKISVAHLDMNNDVSEVYQEIEVQNNELEKLLSDWETKSVELERLK